MKNTRLIFTTAFMTLIVFAGITYSSCTKSNNSNPCANVICLNNGTCDNGSCSCAAGYTGSTCQTLATTNISYTNNTYTPISIVVNGNSQTIAVGSTVSYSGTFGSTLTGTATTSGTYGKTETWNLSNVFPSTGTANTGLDVSSTDFFLKIENNGSQYITTAFVNYGLSPQQTVSLSIPNNGTIYGVGYFAAYTNTDIKLTSSSYNWTFNSPIGLSFLNNQSFTAIANP